MISIFIAELIFGQATGGAGALASTTNSPTSQIISELNYSDVRTPHLLAFKTQEDRRPWYVEEALLALELKDGRWKLSHVGRNPKVQTPAHYRLWTVYSITDVPHVGEKVFDRRPTEAETHKFLEDTWWKWGASDDFRLLRGEVYTNAWREALGYSPTYAFPIPNPRKAKRQTKD